MPYRSIRKTFYKSELEKLYIDAQISENESLIHQIENSLLDDITSKQLCLLKNNIRTKDDIKKALMKIENQNITNSIITCLTVENDLKLHPDIKKIIFSSEPIAFFIGTGISNLLNIPLWGDLAKLAIEELKKEHFLNETEATKLKNEYLSPKQVISIFHSIYKEDKSKLKEFYHNKLSSNGMIVRNPYILLKKLENIIPKDVIKITTNLDKEWENVLNRKNTVSDKEEKPSVENDIIPIFCNFTKGAKFETNKLYKIHGSIDDIDNSIMTARDYVEKYRDEKGLKGFLEEFFDKYNVIFFGTSLQEIEILEHIIKGKEKRRKYYAIIDSNYGDDNLFRIKQNYYNDINIKSIPFYIDFQGFQRFNLVIENWIKEIEDYLSPNFIKKAKIIDEVMLDDFE